MRKKVVCLSAKAMRNISWQQERSMRSIRTSTREDHLAYALTQKMYGLTIPPLE